MSGDREPRVGIHVSSTPAPEHVSYVAGALVEVLTAGAQHRTSDCVMHAALDVLRLASASVPASVEVGNVSMGDERVTSIGVDRKTAA